MEAEEAGKVTTIDTVETDVPAGTQQKNEDMDSEAVDTASGQTSQLEEPAEDIGVPINRQEAETQEGTPEDASVQGIDHGTTDQPAPASDAPAEAGPVLGAAEDSQPVAAHGTSSGTADQPASDAPAEGSPVLGAAAEESQPASTQGSGSGAADQASEAPEEAGPVPGAAAEDSQHRGLETEPTAVTNAAAPLAGTGEPSQAKQSVEPAVQLAAAEAQASSEPASSSAGKEADARVCDDLLPDGSLDLDSLRLKPDLSVALAAESATMLHLLTLDPCKRNNLFYIADNVVLTAAGNSVVFLNLDTMAQTYLQGVDGGGVAAVTVHPSRSLFAVAEKCKGRAPNIYIYEYPSLRAIKALRGGTERAYSALVFSEDGTMLASVGGYPDYLLTLWDWKTQSIILRSKAFSQDVYTVKFSPHFPGILTTSGTGHIRFWKMASTFTGLKLQGQIGKFGGVELSDVSGFVEMPDGKVLSGTEGGNLIMWDGGLIKVLITRSGGKPCHAGAVDVLMHDRSSHTLLTGGSDGYVRLWNFEKMNDAEAEDDVNTTAIEPFDELLIERNARLKSVLWERGHWLVLDEAGALFKVHLTGGSSSITHGAVVQKLLEFHSGPVTGLQTCPTTHLAITAGMDGSVRIYDYRKRQSVGMARYTAGATCMASLPLHVDERFRTFVLGFQDGVLRCVLRCRDGWKLVGAFKPHKGSVASVAVAPNGVMVATVSSDSTVFFFRTDTLTSFTPIAFTSVGAPCACAAFSADSTKLLIGCSNGAIVEVDVPMGHIDVSRTYEHTMPHRSYKFKAPKPKRVKVAKKEEQGAAGSGGEGGAGAVADGAEGASKAADGAADTQQEEGDAGEEEDDALDMAEAFGDSETPAILTISCDPSDASLFRVTVAGRGAGRVFECSWDAPEARVVADCWPSSSGITHVAFSRSGKLSLLGSTDGVVRVQPVVPRFGAAFGKYWEGQLHDMQSGAVSAVATSFDDCYLVTSARDGAIYVQELRMAESGPAQPGRNEELPLVAEEQAGKGISDITDPKAYSIEEAKQKAEEDSLIAAAEAKKMSIREFLQQIRADFEALLAENESKPEAERLPRTEFEIDVGLREMIEAQTREQEEALRCELQWESERARLALAKLRAAFLDDVEVERIVLRAFRSNKMLTTFRTARLSPQLQEELAHIRKEAEDVREGDGSQSGGDTGSEKADQDQKPDVHTSSVPELHSQGAKQGAGVEGGKAISKAEVRRLARKQREAEWAAFNATKPDDSYENAADVAAIDEARANMGDFKLKTDPEYVVPEEERMTPQKKRRQMALLEEGCHNIRMEFNARFLALREVKRKVVAEIASRHERLRQINASLGIKEALVDPVMAPDEWPESREEVSDQDVEEFMRRKEEAGRKAAGGGLGGFAASAAPPAGKAADGAKKAAGDGKADGGRKAEESTMEDALAKALGSVPPSELEKAEQQYNKRKMEYERQKIKGEIGERMEAFDEALTQLRREKFRLEADLKLAEIKKMVLYQELSLLKEFEKRELVLFNKRQAKLEDRAEVLEKISECQDKLESKKSELEGGIAKKASVVAELDTLIGDGDQFREALSKIFHRKIKRSKKRGAGADDDDDDDDDDDGDDEEGDEEDEGEDEVCPPGCDQGMYEKVCELRERRLDEEDSIGDVQKAIEQLKKDREMLSKKSKLVEGSLAAIGADIVEFQKEKQAALNQIEVLVNLRMHQVEYLLDGRLPEDLSQALVFSNMHLTRLKQRITELDSEKGDLRAAQRELRKQHAQLLKDKAAKESRIGDLEGRAQEIQMLKFGQIVDLDLLDRIGVSKGTEELKEQLAQQESMHAAELAEWDAKVAVKTAELTSLTRENTAALNAVSGLTQAHKKLESGLAATRKRLMGDPIEQRRKEVEERDRLVTLINTQAQDIERLKAQITALRRKDTSVYS